MSQESILIVEDAVVIAEHLKMLVENQGYEVAGIVDSGEAAVEKVEAEVPDLVLMDIKLLGDIDGIESAQRIEAEHDESIGIVYVTAYGDEATLQRARESGAEALFTKPVRKNALDWILRWYFGDEEELPPTPASLQAWFFDED